MMTKRRTSKSPRRSNFSVTPRSQQWERASGHRNGVALGHHPGTRTGEVKLILTAPDGAGVSVTTANQPSPDRTSEFTSIRSVELMIDETPCHLEAGVDDQGRIIIQ